MKKVISPKGRRPKTAAEKAQDAINAAQAVKDLYQLRDHYGSWANITSECGIPKSTLEGIYKGERKVVGAATLAWIKAALHLVWLDGRNGRLLVENEQLKRKIDKLLVHEG